VNSQGIKPRKAVEDSGCCGTPTCIIHKRGSQQYAVVSQSGPHEGAGKPATARGVSLLGTLKRHWYIGKYVARELRFPHDKEFL